MMQFDVLFSKDNALTSVRALFFLRKNKKISFTSQYWEMKI